MLKLAMLACLAAIGAFASTARAGAADSLQLQLVSSPAHGEVRLFWAGDTSTSTVLPFYLATDGRWVGGYYLKNDPGAPQNTGLIYGQPSGVQTFKVCEDKAQTVCSNVRAVTVR